LAQRVKKLLFAAPGRIQLVADALDAPPPGHALVRTLTSAISAGSELLAFRGQLPADTPLDETLGALGQATFAFPFPYGYACVGEIAAVGVDVDVDADAAWVGRRVFAFQPHATMFVAPLADLRPVPDGLAPERAALFAQMETAINLVLDGAPLQGETVLVIGLGVVGLLTTALLSRFPLAALAVSEPRPRRTQAARALAARPIVTGADEIRSALGARGADLVYELSGNPEALDEAIAAAGHEASSARGTATNAPASTWAAASTGGGCGSSAARSATSAPRCRRAGIASAGSTRPGGRSPTSTPCPSSVTACRSRRPRPRTSSSIARRETRCRCCSTIEAS
jgi:2-desacetyl-2-hydroxyethyl bacteriochlorophyllide A dehydrogenase